MSEDSRSAPSLARRFLSRADPSAERDAQSRTALLAELRARLINIEEKADGALRRLDGFASTRQGFGGSPDQPFGCTTYAQFGEDLIILNLFHMLGVADPSYLDVGAHHPFHISNTALLHIRGSRGINVEANPTLIEAFRQHRSEDINLNVGVGPERGAFDFYFIDEWSGRNTFSRQEAEDFVRQHPRHRIRRVQPIAVVTLDDIVAEHAAGQFPDLLSVDVEGMDFDVLRSASLSEDRPTVICVEAEWDASDRAARLGGLLRDRGYALCARTVANMIFMRAAAAATLGIGPG